MLSALTLLVLQGTLDQPLPLSRYLPFFTSAFLNSCVAKSGKKNFYEVLIVYDGFLQRVLLEITLSDGGRHLSTQVGSFSLATGQTQVLPVPPPPCVICYLGDVSQTRIQFVSRSLS